MTIELLRALYQKRPFEALDIHLVDGRALTVEHPECLAWSKSWRTIAAARPDDVIETIDLLLVASVKPAGERYRALPASAVEAGH